MNMQDIPKQYDPKDAQDRWYEFWVKNSYFHAEATSDKPAYCIVIPPPNVTGALHLGHALNNTLQDILIRWRRMQGFDCLWMPGTDHAGIATQAVVEKRLLEEEKKTRHDLGRPALVDRIWAWKDEYEKRILSQLRLMGCSCDWDRTRFTLDAVCSRAVRRTFFNLFKAGKIFRGKRLVNWDTQLRTAVADDEIYYEEVQGHLWTIKYPIAGSSEVLHVATTRPETMLGDTAVAVHPDDPRYQHLLGKMVNLPLTGRQIPIIADPVLVDPAFGTGCVKVTPAHDPNDYQAGLRNGLPMINLLNPDGTYNENAGPKYAGLDRMVVRKRVVEDLKAQGLLERVDSYLVRLNHSDRSKTPIEPYLSDQWFVRMGDEPDGTPGFAQEAMDAVTSGRVKIHPDRYAKSYLDWLGEKRDWCISRQLWWGHRIPIWSCETCTESDLARAFSGCDNMFWRKSESSGWLICSESDLAADALGPSHSLIQDPDVLDTWFSSALWPHSTLGWPEETPELAKFYPTSVLSTARDIITLWVARMVIFGQFNKGDVPFRDVYIHPVIQDGKGQRMSKTAGNGVDPVDIIEIYGADALRFTLAAGATETQDLRMPVEKLKLPDDRTINTSERFEQGRNFANKFWNVARLAMMNLEGFDPDQSSGDLGATEIEDRWILGRLARTASEATSDLESFQFADLARRLRDFVWNDFCDWYVELIKLRLRDPDGATRGSAQRTLVFVLDGLCRLLHPVMPFVTEQVWQALNQAAPRRHDPTNLIVREAPRSVCVAPWPVYPPSLVKPTAKDAPQDVNIEVTPLAGTGALPAISARREPITLWQEVITAIRNLRAERKIPPTAKIHPVIVAQPEVADQLRKGESHIRSLAGAEDVTIRVRPLVGSSGLADVNISAGAETAENVEAAQRPEESASAVVGDAKIIRASAKITSATAVLADAEIIVPLEGLIDKEAERAKLKKSLADLERQIGPLAAKLANEAFVSRAPAEVVQAQRAKLADLQSQEAAVAALLAQHR